MERQVAMNAERKVNANAVQVNAWSAPGRLLQRSVSALLTWQERSNQRHQLSHLSDHILKDIGVSRADVEREASKPFWRR